MNAWPVFLNGSIQHVTQVRVRIHVVWTVALCTQLRQTHQFIENKLGIIFKPFKKIIRKRFFNGERMRKRCQGGVPVGEFTLFFKPGGRGLNQEWKKMLLCRSSS